MFKATPVQKLCVSHSSDLNINRLQATTTLHVHFKYEAVTTYSLLMLRKEFPWTNEVMASEVVHSLSSVTFISNPIWPVRLAKLLVASEIHHYQLV